MTSVIGDTPSTHPGSAQVAPTAGGVLWLGVVLHPNRRRVKARKMRAATRRLARRAREVERGDAPAETFEASLAGWLAHTRGATGPGYERFLRRRVAAARRARLDVG